VYRLYCEDAIKCKQVILFNGNMQDRSHGVQWMLPPDAVLAGRDYVFVDDSIYSGNTAQTIADFLQLRGAQLKYIRVAYDGSKTTLPFVVQSIVAKNVVS
jgi:glutamine phosphoribosylpyrophosphate amidotransferase